LHVPIEHVISLVILVILGFIVSFALGVEKGKRQHASQEAMHPVEVVETAEKVEFKKTDASREPEIEKIGKPIQEKPIVKKEKPYTIQLVSYKARRDADQKIKRLKAEDIDAFIVHNKKWFQICSGSYANKKEAEKDLNNLSKKYKGCFLREKEQ